MVSSDELIKLLILRTFFYFHPQDSVLRFVPYLQDVSRGGASPGAELEHRVPHPG